MAKRGDRMVTPSDPFQRWLIELEQWRAEASSAESLEESARRLEGLHSRLKELALSRATISFSTEIQGPAAIAGSARALLANVSEGTQDSSPRPARQDARGALKDPDLVAPMSRTSDRSETPVDGRRRTPRLPSVKTLSDATKISADIPPTRTRTPSASPAGRISPPPRMLRAERFAGPSAESLAPMGSLRGIAGGLALTAVALLGLSASVQQWRGEQALAEIRNLASKEKIDRDKATMALTRGTLLSRWDGQRDYLAAQLIARVEGITRGKTSRESAALVREHLRRAIERQPLSVPYRLTLARADQRWGIDQAERRESANALEMLPVAQADCWKTRGEGELREGRVDKAAECFRRACSAKPELTSSVLSQLLERRATAAISIALSDHPRALESAAQFLKGKGLNWEKDIADRLRDFDRRSSSDPREHFASARLWQSLGQADRALAAWGKGLALASESEQLRASPEALEARLALARLHWERNEFADCDRLTKELLSQRPTGDLASAARLLREKVELANRKTSGPASPQRPVQDRQVQKRPVQERRLAN